jgi:hypothetical protein
LAVYVRKSNGNARYEQRLVPLDGGVPGTLGRVGCPCDLARWLLNRLESV